MSMTRKHYVALAAALSTARSRNPGSGAFWFNAGIDAAAEQIGRALAADNPRFDSARFMRAAQVPKEIAP